MLRIKLFFSLILLNIFVSLSFGQVSTYDGPDDPAADPQWVRAGYMDGNRVYMYFKNTGQVSNFDSKIVGTTFSRWPNDYTGVSYVDNLSVMVGAEIYITQDSIPVTDLNEVKSLAAQGLIDTLYYIEGSGISYLDPDKNATRTIEWGPYPVPEYCNQTSDLPAISDKPFSWPPSGWPSTGNSKKWQGEWNGRFGRGIAKADLETFFVVNDAQDLEYIIKVNSELNELRSGNETRYYPRPGVLIGDKRAAVSQQAGLPWGGLGLRTEVRGYQWNNPEARDIIFWEFNITNISDYDILTAGFGYFIDNSIGGDTGNDSESARFSDLLDLSFVWESLGVGVGGRPTGVFGNAYLENPGLPNDNIDNDMDGITDEKRDNDAGQLIGPKDGYSDLNAFLRFYELKEEELKEHWSGDEDQDWENGLDLNGNGAYSFLDDDGIWKLEPGEVANDDVGLDGVGPGDLNYNGPDEGEGNGKPDWKEGVGGEPNFAALDVSESDMIGLTSFQIFDYGQWQGWNLKLGYDEEMWNSMDKPKVERQTYGGSATSLYEIFASTRFNFKKGKTERISTAMLFTNDTKSNLISSPPSAPLMFALKKTVQLIYERDYRFAQPPIMPTLKALAKDGEVLLTWDDISDRFTKEPFLGNKNDFEGYKIYKATDKTFQDAEIVTDGFGNRKSKAAIFQCDLKDNITGFADYGVNEGKAYYLGEDTGIRHYYIDKDVKNGVTYYYAVVAYDYGLEAFGISPTENNISIKLGEDESVIRTSRNVAIAVPGPRAAGFVPADIEAKDERTSEAIPSNMIVPQIADPDLIKPNNTYKVSFKIDTVGYAEFDQRYRSIYDGKYTYSGMSVYNVTENNELVYEENPTKYFADHMSVIKEEDAVGNVTNEIWFFNSEPFNTNVFEGIQLQMTIYPNLDSAKVNKEKTGWITGYSPMNIHMTPESVFFPYEYEIVFTGDPTTYTTTTSATRDIRGISGNVISPASLILNQSFDFYVINKSVTDENGNYVRLDLVVHDLNENQTFEWNEDEILVGYNTLYKGKVYWSGAVFVLDWKGSTGIKDYPETGDTYHFSMLKTLTENDEYYFTVNSSQNIDKDLVQKDMKEIRVVPNPYIGTSILETSVINKNLNQQRKIMFTNIPAQSIIRIFSSSGVLIDEIEVFNEPGDGKISWNLKSRENLEVASGMYFYHVKSNLTGDEKVGKFAIIK